MRRLCLLSLLTGLLLPRHASAQAAASVQTGAVYAYIVADDTVSFEVVRGEGERLRGSWAAPQQPRVQWDQVLLKGAPGPLTVAVFAPDAPASAPPYTETDFARRNDSMVVTTRDQQRVRTQTLPSRTAAMPVVSRSMLHLAYLAYYASQERLTLITLFLTGSGKTVDARVEVLGEEVTITVEGLTLESTWIDGVLMEMRVPTQALVVKRLMALPPQH